MRDPYDVLEIRRGASMDEINEAYKKMAAKYHPEQYQDNPLRELAEEKMREVNEAYDQLTQAGQTDNHKYQSNSQNYGYNNRNAYYGQRQRNYNYPYGNDPGRRRGYSAGNMCNDLACLCCADSCCECMGGDLIPCC